MGRGAVGLVVSCCSAKDEMERVGVMGWRGMSRSGCDLDGGAPASSRVGLDWVGFVWAGMR